VLAQGLGGTAYYLICAIIGLMIAAMAANEWRRLGMNDYLRVVVAAGAVVLGRMVGALLLSAWPRDVACLEWALEGLTLLLFTLAFLYRAFPTQRLALLYLALSLAVVGGLLGWCVLAQSEPVSPSWLGRAWPALLLVLSCFALAQWAYHRRQFSAWLVCAWGVSLLAAAGGLLGWLQVAVLGHLAALSLFAIETYRAILADLAAFGYELQDVSERALRQTREMAFLLEVSQAIAASLDLPVVLERVSEAVARAVNADWAYILLPPESDADKMAVAVQYGWWGRRRKQDAEPVRQIVFSPADFPGLHQALQQRHQVLANEPEEYEPFGRLHEMLGRTQNGPTLVQPILLKERSLGAVLLGHVAEQAFFSEEDAKLCQALVGQVATAIDNARLYQSVDDQTRRLVELLRVREEEATQRQAILESIADGVVVAGGGGDVVLANAAAERILGLSREQLLGQTIKRLYAELLRARGRGSGAQAVFEWDDKVVKGNLAPVKMPDGTLLGYVAVFRDVTLEQQAEQAKSQFVATVSHELRTPMTSIKGYIELIAAGAAGVVNQQQRHFLNVVDGNTERMIGLVNNLIAVSEMERGLIRIEPRPVDLKSVIEDAVQAVRSKAEERRQNLNVSVPADLVPARGDAQRLRQIVDNLLDNALRYTPVEGRVDVWAAEVALEENGASPQHYVVVNVRDTGVGIGLEEQGRIFEKFYRAENSLSIEAGGTGMGLAIVKTLVEAHGGRVWVESKPGAGSTFSFIVPTTRPGPRATARPGSQ
jgi:PAS domain S-box-containing protein